MSQASSTTEIHTDIGISSIVEAVYPFNPKEAYDEMQEEMGSMAHQQAQTGNFLSNLEINIEGAAWVGLVVLVVVAYLIYNKKTRVGATVFSWSRVYDDIKRRFRKDKERESSIEDAFGRDDRGEVRKSSIGRGQTSDESIRTSTDSRTEELQKDGEKVEGTKKGTGKSDGDGDDPRQPKARLKKD